MLGPPPRDARIRRSTWLIGTAVPTACLVLALTSWQSDQQALDDLQEIITNGTETVGQVVGRRTARSRRSTRYLVMCRYVVDRREYTGEFESKTVYDRAPREAAVVLSYIAEDPVRARLGSRAALERRFQRDLWLLWVPPAILILAGSVFAAFYWSGVRVSLRLARDGVVRWGAVTKIRRVKGNTIATVAVDDHLGSAVAKGKAGVGFARLQPIGSQAAVLSDPDDPGRVKLAAAVATQIEIE